MCGASNEQKQLQEDQIKFYEEAQNQSRATFGEQQAILQQLQSVYSPILQRGPNAKGFSAEQRNDLDATVVDGTAHNYATAARAVNRNIAAQGGAPGMTTGAQMQLKAEVGNAAAEQQSSEQSQVLQADYAEGYNQFKDATSALATASGQLNPASYMNATTGAGSAASDTADRIAQENNSWVNAAIGAAGTIGGAAMCPVVGTLILMADGSQKLVEQIEMCEQVQGIDGEPNSVLFVRKHKNTAIVRMASVLKSLRASTAHSLCLEKGGYVFSGHAKGKTVLSIDGPATILTAELDSQDTVVSLLLDGSHTYCANGFWSLSD